MQKLFLLLTKKLLLQVLLLPQVMSESIHKTPYRGPPEVTTAMLSDLYDECLP
jgi:hypothetical protein